MGDNKYFKLLPLSQGKFAIVDEEDYEFLSQWKWCFDGRYAVRRVNENGKHKLIRMHRFIMNPPEGKFVDHINTDKLDNRKSNLRFCTNAENMRNRSVQKNNKSGFVGVFWNKKHKKWQSQIKTNGKTKYIGLFSDLIEAAKAYDKYAITQHGEFARLNIG